MQVMSLIYILTHLYFFSKDNNKNKGNTGINSFKNFILIDRKPACIIILTMFHQNFSFCFLKNRKMSFFSLIFILVLSAGLFASGAKDSKIEETVISNNTSAIKAALKKNIDLINYVNPVTKDNLLFTALKNNCSGEVIQLLLKYGVSGSQKNINEEIPLMYACKYSSPETVELMLQSESQFAWQKKMIATKTDKDGLTAFDYAAERPEIIAVLEKQTKYEYSKIKTQEEIQAAVQTVAEKTAEVEAQQEKAAQERAAQEQALLETQKTEEKTENLQEDSEQPVIQSESREEPEEIMALKFMPVYLFDENDNAVLFEEEKPLTEHPAYSAKDINIVDSQGRTSLMKAAAENNIILMHQLIHSGADVNAQDNDGWTAAMFSIRYGGTDLPLRMLQESGANLKHKNKFGISALQIAARYNDDENVFAFLLKDRLATENEVRSSFITSICSQRSVSILKQFMKYGMPLNQFYSGGMTPLMFAAKNNTKTEIIDFLIKNGAEINIRSKEGKTAFDYASENRRLRRDEIFWKLNANGEKR